MIHNLLGKARSPLVLPGRKQRMYDFLRSHPIGVLSTVDPNGDPHGVVIYFATDKDCNITFLTRTGTRKYDNLRRHDRIMLTVCEPKSQTTVQVTGVASIIRDPEQVIRIAADNLGASLRTSEAGLSPLSKLQAGDFVGVRIVPAQVRMAVFERPDPGGYSEIFESVESFELRPDSDG